MTCEQRSFVKGVAKIPGAIGMLRSWARNLQTDAINLRYIKGPITSPEVREGVFQMQHTARVLNRYLDILEQKQ